MSGKDLVNGLDTEMSGEDLVNGLDTEMSLGRTW